MLRKVELRVETRQLPEVLAKKRGRERGNAYGSVQLSAVSKKLIERRTDRRESTTEPPQTTSDLESELAASLMRAADKFVGIQWFKSLFVFRPCLCVSWLACSVRKQVCCFRCMQMAAFVLYTHLCVQFHFEMKRTSFWNKRWVFLWCPPTENCWSAVTDQRQGAHAQAACQWQACGPLKTFSTLWPATPSWTEQVFGGWAVILRITRRVPHIVLWAYFNICNFMRLKFASKKWRRNGEECLRRISISMNGSDQLMLIQITFEPRGIPQERQVDGTSSRDTLGLKYLMVQALLRRPPKHEHAGALRRVAKKLWMEGKLAAHHSLPSHVKMNAVTDSSSGNRLRNFKRWDGTLSSCACLRRPTLHS